MKAYLHKTQYYETDQMGIIHHSNYIRWFEEARIDFLEQMGYGYLRLEEEGIYSPVLEVQCTYKSRIKFGDVVEIQIILKESTPYRFTVAYQFYDRNTGSLRAYGETRHCYINKEGLPISIKRTNLEFFQLLSQQLKKEED